MAKVRQEVSELFAPLWERDDWRYAILMGGRGAGRSTAGSQYALSNLLAPPFFRGAFMRAIHSDIRNSLWQEFNDRVDGQGIREALKITDNDMYAEYGQNTIQAHGFKTSGGSHTAKLKSLANYNFALIEEADETGEREFMTFDDSLRTKQGKIRIILMLNSPPKNHWIIQKFFDLEESGVQGFFVPKLKEGSNALYIGGTHRDNLANLDEETVKRYQAYKNKKPDYYYQVIEGLVPEVVRGKIYRDWQLIDELPKEARLLRFGVDFGWFPDPACVVAIYYWNGGYIVDELAYGTELTNEFLANTIKNVGKVLTVADSAEPKSIAEMQKYGVRITGTEKGPDSVDYRIKVVSTKKVWVTRRSTNVWHSYENYAWAEDKDGNPKGEPVHTHSHAMDATGYALISLQNKNTDPDPIPFFYQTKPKTKWR